MVRPIKTRIVDFEPNVTYFKPKSIPMNQLEEVTITFDELEALRLSNLEKLSQTDAANKMDVHQSTFQRTLSKAAEKITDALVNGKAVKIQGGNYCNKNHNHNQKCEKICICPKCGHEEEHIRGIPCIQMKCPKCKSLMTRK